MCGAYRCVVCTDVWCVQMCGEGDGCIGVVKEMGVQVCVEGDGCIDVW